MEKNFLVVELFERAFIVVLNNLIGKTFTAASRGGKKRKRGGNHDSWNKPSEVRRLSY